jgi:signal transduction histidine kinase
MHDVVAHGMSVMVVQAAAAEHLLTSDPSRAREPLATVRHTGHESLDEMRRLLGLLRTDDGDGVGRAPQPCLAQIPDLIARLQAAGRPVSLRIEGPDIDVPAGVGLCAYRIVQESLTNALKHAAGAESAVTLVREPDWLTVTILNGQPPQQPASPGTLPGASLGIRGMRERAAIYGGKLTAAPTSDGGFVVRATLPIRA